MRKKDELSLKHTCMQHAHSEEMVFVLLGRDVAAPSTIRAWVAERIRLGKNVETDAQITEALACACTMEVEGRKWAVLLDTCDFVRCGHPRDQHFKDERGHYICNRCTSDTVYHKFVEPLDELEDAS